MIVYQSTKSAFVVDALDRDIEEIVQRAYTRRTGASVAPGEFRAWRESLVHMARVLRDEQIPPDCGVAIEYRIPQTAKRVDFIITGRDEAGSDSVIIVELKQWSKACLTDKDGIIAARRGGRSGEIEGPHPCYQAWSYAALLKGFNEAVFEGGVELSPCAYLHNYDRDGVIDHAFYSDHIQRAPLFLKGEEERKALQAFVRRHVRSGDDGRLLYRIENGRIRPSKALADSVVGMLCGKAEFVLIDDQKVVFETILRLAEKAARGRKQVAIVSGGPGTGKSVVAINLLARLTSREMNTRYVSKNAAPRAVYGVKLTGSFRKCEISNLFSGSGAFTGTKPDSFDVLVVDEAHRLNERSGLYGNLGENQIKELIQAARCTVFFVDNDQRVTLRDIGDSGALRNWAEKLDAEVTDLSLSSQFRCNGSDGYLAWLDNTLGIRTTANDSLDTKEFDFRVFDSASDLHSAIESYNQSNNRARVVAGYCWPWRSKKDPKAIDIDIPDSGYRRQWNLSQYGSLWIVAPESVKDVGCIHTCQGLELDYVGVIIGPDLVVRTGRVVTKPEQRARSDKSLHGLVSMRKTDPAGAQRLARSIILNTYRTLMTRGMKGCFVYCCDSELAAYLRSKVVAVSTDAGAKALEPVVPLAGDPTDVLPFRRVPFTERLTTNAVPLIDLQIAAGGFGQFQTVDNPDAQWVELPDGLSASPGLFIAKVVGESMNRFIRNGAWCLFRANPAGTRVGKIVVAQHRSISDPELGGCFTIKRYFSCKSMEADDAWKQTRIELRPESDRSEFQTITIETAEEGEFRIVAELVAVLV